VLDLSSPYHDNSNAWDIGCYALLFEVGVESSQVAGIRAGLRRDERLGGE
jgi:hypothetical protein